jgi:hypothetical protein
MLLDFANGQTSVIIRVKLRNSSVATGAGLTGLTSASTGLRISTIADNEAAATAYTAAGATIESIATLGTYAAPTATKCRFKEVDATNHPGLYELQIADARFAVAGAKSLTITLSGATNLAECDVVIPLRAVNPYDAQRFGLAALPAAGTLAVKPAVTLAAADVTGNLPADLQTIKGQAVTAAAGVTFPASIASPTNITAGTIATVTTLTNLPAAPTDWLSAAAVSAAAVNKVQAGLSTYAGGDTAGTTTLLARLTSTRAGLLDNLDAAVSSRLAASGYTAPPSAGAVATAVMTDVSDTLGAAIVGVKAVTDALAPMIVGGAYTTAALANAPAGGGSAPDPWAVDLTATAYSGGQAGKVLRLILADAAGSLTQAADGSTTTIRDALDPTTTQITSVNTSTSRTTTVH